MNFYQERETVERLREDKSKLVFWKTDTAHAREDGVIIKSKLWTTSSSYLKGNKLHEFGSDKLLCESWIDEDYLNEICNGENIVVITE